MVSKTSGEPKVTPCLILIQDTINVIHAPAYGDRTFKHMVWNEMMLKTAVKKYHIGLGQKIKKFKLGYHIFEATPRTAVLTYPLIQITENGLVALKCPTISGKHAYSTRLTHIRGCKGGKGVSP